MFEEIIKESKQAVLSLIDEANLEKGDIVVISGGAKMLNTNSENQIVDGILKI